MSRFIQSVMLSLWGEVQLLLAFVAVFFFGQWELAALHGAIFVLGAWLIPDKPYGGR